MAINRRTALTAGFGVSASATFAAAAPSIEPPAAAGHAWGLVPNAVEDQSAALQAAIDQASAAGVAIELAPGSYRVNGITLRSNTRILAKARTASLVYMGGTSFIGGENADGIVLHNLVFDGLYRPLGVDQPSALLTFNACRGLTIDAIEVRNSAMSGLLLQGCAGRISQCHVADVLDAGVRAVDSAGLDITGNTVSDCGNNGIQVWRSGAGEDGTTVTANRIARIRAASGGSGENGNGINVFRAGSVLVQGNRISDCAYSAVRGNAASNIQIVANSCERLSEVALYAEFGFEGALIANNLVAGAATGISVTNFNEGGRLAVIQGNLIRNLFRREDEPQDKRGEGIAVEADAAVTGNTIENAPTVGIAVGWGPHMRNVAVTGNVVHTAGVGIAITDAEDAGACLVANNMISATVWGAVRMSSHGLPAGPDLATEPPRTGRITIKDNVVA